LDCHATGELDYQLLIVSRSTDELQSVSRLATTRGAGRLESHRARRDQVQPGAVSQSVQRTGWNL